MPSDSTRDFNLLRFFDGSWIGGCDCARGFSGSSTGVGVSALLRFFGFSGTFGFQCGVNLHIYKLDYIWETYSEVVRWCINGHWGM